MTSESEELETTTPQGRFPNELTRFPEKSLQIPRIITNFAMKLRMNMQIQ